MVPSEVEGNPSPSAILCGQLVFYRFLFLIHHARELAGKVSCVSVPALAKTTHPG